jgi:hypothetical protein
MDVYVETVWIEGQVGMLFQINQSGVPYFILCGLGEWTRNAGGIWHE